jgi:hypothetical protein
MDPLSKSSQSCTPACAQRLAPRNRLRSVEKSRPPSEAGASAGAAASTEAIDPSPAPDEELSAGALASSAAGGALESTGLPTCAPASPVVAGARSPDPHATRATSSQGLTRTSRIDRRSMPLKSTATRARRTLPMPPPPPWQRARANPAHHRTEMERRCWSPDWPRRGRSRWDRRRNRGVSRRLPW